MRILNENANQCNKYINSIKIKLSKVDKWCKIWENYNCNRKLIRLNEFIDYSSRKHNKEEEEGSKQIIKSAKWSLSTL